MTEINARGIDFKDLNDQVHGTPGDLTLIDCYGQRFVAAGSEKRTITIHGTPGNALGAYLDGALIDVQGNAQDAVGDTMNEGAIVVHGRAGDALGYGMRGGEIYVKGDVGCRTGIHMKEYNEKRPVIVVGGRAGSFLGEYMAGGLIVLLGIGADDVPLGEFTGTGMHGGHIFIRSPKTPTGFPPQVDCACATAEDMQIALPFIQKFAETFGEDLNTLTKGDFYLLTPSKKSSYKQTYVHN